LYGAEMWTLRKVYQKYLKSFQKVVMKISCADRMRNEEVLQRVHEERNILHTTKRIKALLIGYILCRNCLLKHVTEGKTEGRT
jgi:hypothetical protein